MKLKRASSGDAPIPLVPMIDVLMIMLVFFMVTSTYLNLRMIPIARSDDAPSQALSTPTDGSSETLLLRLDPDGTLRVRGAALAQEQLVSMLQERLQETPGLNVVLLPSGRSSTQALVSLLDATSSAGVTRLRLVRLEAGQ